MSLALRRDDSMRRFNVRIGTKLGITAAIGFAIVVAMAANQLRSRWVSQQLDAEIKAADNVDRAVLEAEVSLRRVSIQFRSIRGSGTAAEVDGLVKRIKEIEAPANKVLDEAIANTSSPANRANLTKAKEL